MGDGDGGPDQKGKVVVDREAGKVVFGREEGKGAVGGREEEEVVGRQVEGVFDAQVDQDDDGLQAEAGASLQDQPNLRR